MTRNILILLGYYAIALAVLVAWTYADHALTRRRAGAPGAATDRSARGFAVRVSALLGVLAGVGAALLLHLLLTPAPATWVLAATGAGVLVLTFAVALLVLRLSRAWFGIDPLAELRGAPGSAPEATPQGREDSPSNGEEQH